MPVRYRIFSEQRLVHATGDGAVTVADLLAHWESLAADPRYRAPMLKLVDYRHIAAITVDRARARELADAKRHYRDRFAGERCAIVTNRDVDFGISRMHGAHMDDSGVENAVFRTLEEALDWLGVELDPTTLAEPEG